MTPADLAKLNVPSDPRFSPDGTRTAFVVSTPNLEEDRYDRRVWIASDDGTRPFTEGPGDTTPRWSPDGTRLAFLQNDEDTGPQVAVMSLDDGKPSVLTDFDHGVEAMEWAPDGSAILVVAVTYVDEWSDLDDDERDRRPRRVTSVPFQFDGRGWTHDRRRHLWLVDPKGSDDPRCLTPGDYDDEAPAWSPDGRTVAFISDRDPARGLRSGNDVWEVDLSTGDITKAGPHGFWTAVGYRPDGVLHLLGNPDPVYPVDSYLQRREADGTLTDLTGHLDRSSVSLSAGPAAMVWDGHAVVVGLEDSGSFGLVRVGEDGTIATLLEGHQVVTGFDVSAGDTAFTASTWDSPGELHLIREGSDQQVSSLNRDLGLIQPEHFRVDSDGHQIDVWAYLPENSEPVPLLLNIHGGPASQYGFGFFDEFQVYVEAGYGVVACNPRGSSGRGQSFTRAVVGEDWGKVDTSDILEAVSQSLERFPRLDADRLGLMGGSYGGFMTAWIIGQDQRWKSAVVERALLSWTSFSGTSDIGGVFAENYLRQSYPESWEMLWEYGPLAHAHKVTTPTLILHSEDDHRCPIEQAEQYFMALLRNGTPTELLRFPGEGHEMSRSGKPKHRKERFEAILDWHQRYLS